MRSGRVALNDRMGHMRHYLQLLATPLLFLVLFGSLSIMWSVFDLPPVRELAENIEGWFDIYGLPVLFVSAVVEGMLLVGSYFPGIFVIFLSIILADSAFEAEVAVVVATIGLSIAHVCNYALGRYGWYVILTKFGMASSIENARETLVRRGPGALFLSYCLPSLGALVDTAAGIIHMPFKRFFFYSLVSMAFWNTCVAILVYFFRDIALYMASPDSTGRVYIFAAVILWMVVVVFVDYHERRKQALRKNRGEAHEEMYNAGI